MSTLKVNTLQDTSGNNLSFEAAKGICPVINIQPFNAPIPAIIVPNPTKEAIYLPPITSAASTKGAAEFCIISTGKTPNKIVVPEK